MNVSKFVCFARTKLLRESFLVIAKSTSTKPANDGLYNSLFKEELFTSTLVSKNEN
jgi:hypothetical protein